MPERVGADPDVFPRGRDRQRPNPLDDLLVIDPLADALVEVLEAFPAPTARDRRSGTVDASQARHGAARLPGGGDI
jgi:hypothetical protein